MGLGPSAEAVNDWLDAEFCGIPHVVTSHWLDLHLGDPGTGGTASPADIDDRQLATFARTGNGLIVTTGAPAQYVIGADGLITHGSLHTEMTGGSWRWNLIARSPIQVVAGDVLILGDGMEFRVEGFTV